MRKTFTIFLLCFVIPLSYGKTTKTLSSGAWNDVGIWSDGVPESGDEVYISSENEIYLKEDIRLKDAATQIHIFGTLILNDPDTFDVPDGIIVLNEGGKILQYGATTYPRATAASCKFVKGSTYEYNGEIPYLNGIHPTYGNLTFITQAPYDIPFVSNLEVQGNLLIASENGGAVLLGIKGYEMNFNIGGDFEIKKGVVVGADQELDTGSTTLSIGGQFINHDIFVPTRNVGSFQMLLSGSFTNYGSVKHEGKGHATYQFIGSESVAIQGGGTNAFDIVVLKKEASAMVTPEANETFQYLVLEEGYVRLKKNELIVEQHIKGGDERAYVITEGGLLMQPNKGERTHYPVGPALKQYMPISLIQHYTHELIGVQARKGVTGRVPDAVSYFDCEWELKETVYEENKVDMEADFSQCGSVLPAAESGFSGSAELGHWNGEKYDNFCAGEVALLHN